MDLVSCSMCKQHDMRSKFGDLDNKVAVDFDGNVFADRQLLNPACGIHVSMFN